MSVIQTEAVRTSVRNILKQETKTSPTEEDLKSESVMKRIIQKVELSQVSSDIATRNGNMVTNILKKRRLEERMKLQGNK